MSSSPRRPIKFLVFFLLLGFLSVGVYRLAKGPTIQADEVRIYSLPPSEIVSARALVELRGSAAQDAASNFNFSTGGRYFECLDSSGWFRVVFSYRKKAQTFDVYLPNGQIPSGGGIQQTRHLSENSRRYWEQLVKGRH